MFVFGEDLSNAIRRVASGRNLKCAVAFWGKDAAVHLFSESFAKRDDIEIICDLSMGGTNPEELRKLGAPSASWLMHCDGLHAKVYLSDEGLVVASANASNRGIGFLGEAHLVEAGAVFARDEKKGSSWYEAREWFAQLRLKSHQVDAEALSEAEARWATRTTAGLRAGGANLVEKASSLFDFVRNFPEVVSDVGFVFVDRPVSSERKNANRVRDENELGDGSEALEQFSEGWDNINNWPKYFFEFYVPRQKVHVYIRETVVCLPFNNPDTVYAKTADEKDFPWMKAAALSPATIARTDSDQIRHIVELTGWRLFVNAHEFRDFLLKHGI